MKKNSIFEELTRALETRNTTFAEDCEHTSFSIEQMGNMLPGIVMLQDYYSKSLTYINDWGCQYLGRTREELQKMGKAYFESFLHHEDIEENLPKLLTLLEEQDFEKQISFFLRVRKNENEDWEWFFHTAKLYKNTRKNPATVEVILIATPLKNLSGNTIRINKFLDETEIRKKCAREFAKLTNREKEVLKLVALGKNTSDIAEMLFISELTVETHRKNLRKKIQAKSNYDLVLFAQAFDII